MRLIATWNPHRGEEVPFAGLWRQYRLRGRGPARLLRVALWSVATIALAILAAKLIDIGYRIDVPARGEVHRALVAAGQITALLALSILSVAVADATMLSCKFIRFLNQGRSVYPHDVILQQSDRLGTEDRALWRRVVPGVGEAPDHRGHTLLDDWLDVRVVAARTDTVAKLIIGPFVVLALIIIARSRVFDAWSLNLLLATIGAGFLVWMMVLATSLKMHAEKLRMHALARMRVDLQWLAGSGATFKPLVEPFKQLIAAVENNRNGAFAPIFDQPLVRAILVPLGGAGGVQFFDYFLLGH